MASAAPTVSSLHAWRRCAPDLSLLDIPDALVASFNAGSCIALMGRCSTAGGREGRRAAVEDLYGAADLLLSTCGLDVRPYLPSKEDLRERLKAATAETSKTIDGRAFTNRYVMVDVREEAGVVLIVSTGSGHLLDEDGEQPFVRYAARAVRRYNAALFCCKRLDRGAREDWGVAPLMIALRQRDAYLCDEDGLGEIDQVRGFLSFMKGSGSRKVASDLPFHTRSGQKSRSDTELVSGRARYHVASAPPPGFGVCWLRGGGTAPTERMLYLDCDDARPDESLVAHGLAEVYEDESERSQRVDQVENVRFILSVLGKPSWSKKRIVAELCARRYSTVGLRSRHGADATLVNEPERARAMLGSVTDNLSVYETGVLRRNLGAGVEPLEIEGCWPLDGRPWASEKDFARIRRYLKAKDERMAKATRLTFAGTKATFNDSAVVMLSHTRSTSEPSDAALGYSFALQSAYPTNRLAPKGSMILPWHPWAKSLVDAIAEAGDVPLALADAFDLSDPADDGLSQLRADEVACQHKISAGEARLNALQKRLEETDANGELVVRGALMRQLQDQYNDLAENVLPALGRRLAEVKSEMEEMQHEEPDSAPAAAVLQLVESLRDPRDRRFRTVWLASLHNVRFSSERFTRAGSNGRRLTWTGAIRISNDGDTFLIPFHGESEQGAATRVQGRRRSQAEAIVQAMLDGTPYPLADVPDLRRAYPAVVAELGADANRFFLSVCDDPRIVQVATRCYLGESDHEIAAALGVPVALVSRVRQVHVEATAGAEHWQVDRCAAEVGMYVVAARNSGTATAGEVVALADASRGQVYNMASKLRSETDHWITRYKRGYELVACACGSFSRAPMRIAEADGPVCLLCRRDTAGVEWPADPYDRYIAHPTLWT